MRTALHHCSSITFVLSSPLRRPGRLVFFLIAASLLALSTGCESDDSGQSSPDSGTAYQHPLIWDFATWDDTTWN
jgi:hypothetical protein